MRIVTGMHLPRRTVLRGLGVTIALPLLDSMVPALAARPAALAPVKRMGAFYVPMGAHMAAWTPKEDGAAYEMTAPLSPLEPFRQTLVVLTGLNSEEAKIRVGEAGGTHARSQSAWLRGFSEEKPEVSDVSLGP